MITSRNGDALSGFSSERKENVKSMERVKFIKKEDFGSSRNVNKLGNNTHGNLSISFEAQP